MNEAAARLRSRLAALGRVPDGDLDPAEPLLLLAALGRAGRGSPAEVAPYLALLDGMAAELGAELGQCPDAEAVALRLFHLLGRRHRFRGDESDDDELGDLDLLTVLDQRRGGNDALGLLGLAVCRRAGLAADGLAFPTHFLLRVGHPGGSRAIVDPLGDGRPLAACDLWLADYRFEPELPRAWTARGWKMWQYAGDDAATGGPFRDRSRAVRGIDRCDRSVFAGGRDELHRWWTGLPARTGV